MKLIQWIKLNDIIKDKIIQDFNAIIRLRTKSCCLIKMDSELDFDLPQHMIDSDFENMWKDVSTKITSGENQKSERRV